jgi:hypothetical protein
MDNGRGLGELIELRLCPSCGTSLSEAIGDHAPSTARIAIGSQPD